MKLVIIDEAKADLARERRSYETERKGLGREFAAEMREIIERIGKFPLSFPQLGGSTSRRALGRRFPFFVIFFIDDKTIYVTAVVHQHSDPASYH